MRMLKKGFYNEIAVFFFFLLATSTTLFSQNNNLNFINFSSKDGLSSNFINAIMKDRYGYMWFGTNDGLNKFNGVDFTVYTHKPGDSTSIGGNTISALCEDHEGNLWIGTNLALAKFDRKRNKFINYEFTKYSSIRALCVDHLGNIWVGGYGGLFLFNPGTGKLKHYEKGTAASPGKLTTNTILSVFEDSRKRLWVGTNLGLHLYNRESDKFKIFQNSPNDPASISDNVVRDIAEDLNGNIWFATHDGGLNKLLPDGKSFKSYQHNPTNLNSLSGNQIYSVKVDDQNKLWVGMEEGLNIFDPVTLTVTRIIHDNRKQYGLIGKTVRSIFIEKDGTYWLGTSHGGVNKYDKNLPFFNLVRSNSVDPYGLRSPFVTSFAEGPAGDIYIGTDGGGLNLYNRKTRLFQHPALTSTDLDKTLPILAMERVGNDLWIGTFQKGLYVLNMQTGFVRHYSKGDGPQNISSNEIFCIKKDSKGNVWIGTNGGGVSVYDPKSDTFKRWDKKTTDSLGLKVALNGFIRAIEEDKSGNIWIGSVGAGICVYQPSSNTCKILNEANNNLPLNTVYDIYSDKEGTVWVGTSEGLSFYNTKDEKFITFSEKEGLANPIIYKILEGNSGKLWVSSNKGVSSFDKKKRQFRNFSHYNGLQRSPFALRSGLKTANGELFFGGGDGFNFFHPDAFNSNINIPALVFTDLKISNISVIPDEDAAIKDHISIAKEIRLDYKQNFSLDFVALNYTSPRQNRYLYKLDGFDKRWNDVGTINNAAYTNLDPGQYTFRVRAKSEDGSWITPEKTIKIFVKPPLWRTTYAYLFYIIITVFILWFIRYRSAHKFKTKLAAEQEKLRVKQLIEQERKEAERKREFDEQRIRFLTNLSHEFRTPVSLIVGPIEKMLQYEANKEKIEQLNLIHRNGRRLLNLVNQLLDFRKLEETESKLNLNEGDIISFIKDVASSFKDISGNKDINFSFASSVSNYFTQFDRDKIERILFNLLSNSFKFTGKGGEIRLLLEAEGNGLKIVVEDTGIGMSEEVQKKVFEPFFQAEIPSVVLNQGTGIGLAITREFVKLHGGSIHLQSEPGRGSRFTILLPCQEIIKEPEVEDEEIQETNNNLVQASRQHMEVSDSEKMTVLIIEDNHDFRSYLKDNLKPFYKIVDASDGKEGWQKALSCHPKIIVSDINMPVMDGITLSRKLKSDKRTSHIPIILLTALTGHSNQLKGLQTGASDYLTKPFNFEILHVKIKNLVSLNEELRQTYTRQLNVELPKVQVQSEDERLLLQVTEFIESNTDNQNLSVEALSKHVYMSRGSLYNKILTLTGETPVEYIRTIRLKKAADLLENTDMKIAEIAYSVGFTTPNYFARAFKAKYNLSPSDYLLSKRKSNQSENRS